MRKMVRKGNQVVFDEDEQGRDISHILHKATGQKMYMRVENGVYVLDMLVAPPGYREKLGRQTFNAPTSTFGRQVW